MVLVFAFITATSLHAQTKKDGTPDMRYSANRQSYGNSYSTPSPSAPNYYTPTYTAPPAERNYNNGGQYKVQDGYQRSNGSYVAPHIKTNPDNVIYNNYKPRVRRNY